MEALPEFYVPQAPRLARALGLDSVGNRGELLLMDVIERNLKIPRSNSRSFVTGNNDWFSSRGVVVSLLLENFTEGGS